MTRRVIITPDAEEDLRYAYRYIRRDAPLAARRWSIAARKSIKSFSQNAERCPLAPESRSFDEPIRELLFGHGNRGTYRALFIVFPRFIYVLHARHGSQDHLQPIH